MQRRPAIGAKRRVPSIRPEVAAAVGLCGQPAGSLSPVQIQRLDDIATLLRAPPTDDPCAALASVLGDEWTDALAVQDALVEEEARTEHNRVALAASRRARADRAFYGTPAKAILPTSIWGDLVPELRAEVVERIADVDMRTVLALYASGAAARDVIDGLRRDALAVDARGALARVRVPLIDYARLATVLGEADPTRLFLASALCSLKSLADLQVDELNGFEQALGVPRTFGNVEAVIATAPRDAMRGPTGRLVYSALITDGLPRAQLAEAPDEYWEVLASGMGPDVDLRAALSGPLADDLPGAAAQWRNWTVGTEDVLLTDDNVPRLPIAARYGQILGWFGVSSTVVDYLLGTGYGLLRLAPGGPPLSESSIPRMRWLGALGRDNAAALLGRAPSDPALDAWMQGGRSTDEGTIALQNDIDGTDRNLAHDLLRRISEEAALYPASRACAAARLSSRLSLAPLENLLAPSGLWLVPLGPDFVGIIGDLAAPAIDQAIVAAAAPPRA